MIFSDDFLAFWKFFTHEFRPQQCHFGPARPSKPIVQLQSRTRTTISLRAVQGYYYPSGFVYITKVGHLLCSFRDLIVRDFKCLFPVSLVLTSHVLFGLRSQSGHLTHYVSQVNVVYSCCHCCTSVFLSSLKYSMFP